MAPDSLPCRPRELLLSLILPSGLVVAVSDHRREYMVVALAAGVAIRLAARHGCFRWTPYSGLLDVTALLSLAISWRTKVGVDVSGTGRATLDRILGAVVLYILIGRGRRPTNSSTVTWTAYAGIAHEAPNTIAPT